MSTTKYNVAIGNARASATSAPFPVEIANAAPKIPPVITSGGTAAPSVIEPINTISRVAPRMIPVFKSPITNPTSIPVMIGRDPKFVPNIHSKVTNMAINPIRIA